jgi:hypothetical protein
MLWFETFYEAVGLPKLNGVAVNGYFCEPPRLLLIRGADVNPIDNVAVWPDHIGAIFFHRTLYSSLLRTCCLTLKRAPKGCLLKMVTA